MAGIIPETFDVVMERITRRAQQAADAWTTAEMQNPRVDKPAVEEAMFRYLRVRGERMKRLRWFADGTSARAYIRTRRAVEPKPAYWPRIGIARALDLAWFAGAMRPRIEIAINSITAARDWENWIYVVGNRNIALARNPELTLPVELQAIADDFLAPPGPGTPIEEYWFNAILSGISPPVRAVHPERLWAPLIDASAHGLYFFWNGPEEVVCIPRPALWLSESRLHPEDGPAVLWPSGERHFFQHGVEVAPADSAYAR
jgi:hypothetical protein